MSLAAGTATALDDAGTGSGSGLALALYTGRAAIQQATFAATDSADPDGAAFRAQVPGLIAAGLQDKYCIFVNGAVFKGPGSPALTTYVENRADHLRVKAELSTGGFTDEGVAQVVGFVQFGTDVPVSTMVRRVAASGRQAMFQSIADNATADAVAITAWLAAGGYT